MKKLGRNVDLLQTPGEVRFVKAFEKMAGG
jgi:hypothetical protein